MKPIYCNHCGHKITKQANFCPECGQPLSSGITNLEETPVKTVVKKKSRPFLKIIGFIMGGMILLLAGLVVASFFTGNEGGKDEKLDTSGVQIGSVASINVNDSFTNSYASPKSKNRIVIDIPKKTFDDKTQVRIMALNNKPQVKDASIVSDIYDIQIDQKSKRLNQPVGIRIALDKSTLRSLKFPKDLRVGYYAGDQWNYAKPDEINLKKAYIKFTTFHFSTYAILDPKKQKLIDEFAQDKAIEKYSKATNTPLIKKAVQQVILSKLGINNKSFTQDVVESMMNESDFQKLAVSYNDNNKTQFNQDLAILAGKIIVEKVKDYDIAGKSVLKGVTDHASKIGTGVNVAVALSNGDIKQAMKDISNEIINSYPLTKLFREGARVIGNEINRWKNQGVNNAYEVYKTGADKYGYDAVKAGDFEAVWDQMKGVSRQLIIEEKKRYAKQHHKKWDALSESEKKKIEQKVKNSLRKSFEKRSKKEKEITKYKKECQKLIDEFEASGLLTKGENAFPKSASMQLQLRRMFKMADMVLKDTHSEIGYITDTKLRLISRKEIAGLIKLWYSKPNGKEKYRKALVKRGFIKKPKSQQQRANNLDSRLFGTWKFTDANRQSDIRIFKPNGKFISIIYGHKTEMNWKTNNGRLYLYVTGGKQASQTYKVFGNHLSFYIESARVWSTPMVKIK